MIGIYALWWEINSMVYIGRSNNLKLKYKQHLINFDNGTHTNKKVLAQFKTYGIPEYVILEECPLDKLKDRVVFWVKEFNAGKEGLNLVVDGSCFGSGTDHVAAKYSKIQILRVFSLLYKTTMTAAQIAAIVGTSENTINGILNVRRSHKWLQKEYPDKYELVMSRKHRKYHSRDTEIIALLESTILNNSQIAKELDISISIVNGIAAKCLTRKKKYEFINPEGELVKMHGLTGYCRGILEVDNPKVFASGLQQVYSGKLKKYKGWVKA